MASKVQVLIYMCPPHTHLNTRTHSHAPAHARGHALSQPAPAQPRTLIYTRTHMCPVCVYTCVYVDVRGSHAWVCV